MPEHDLASGTVLSGRYRVDALIGRGGMAHVYRGHDLVLGRPTALKVFRSDVADAVDTKRTTREMHLIALVNHPTVVAVLDAKRDERTGDTFLVMEYVEGRDLGTLLEPGPLPRAFARRIAGDVALALTELHRQGVVHRDVKPGNVLVPTGAADDPHVVAAKLTDFGIAQMVDGTRITTSDSILGTAAYLSPEQVRGGRVGPPADVYALGLVLIECITGQRAFPGPSHESAMTRLARSPVLPTGLGAALGALLGRMTDLDPMRRPTAEEVASTLRGGVATGPAEVLGDSPVRRAAPMPLVAEPFTVDGPLPASDHLGPDDAFPVHDPFLPGEVAARGHSFTEPIEDHRFPPEAPAPVGAYDDAAGSYWPLSTGPVPLAPSMHTGGVPVQTEGYRVMARPRRRGTGVLLGVTAAAAAVGLGAFLVSAVAAPRNPVANASATDVRANAPASSAPARSAQRAGAAQPAVRTVPAAQPSSTPRTRSTSAERNDAGGAEQASSAASSPASSAPRAPSATPRKKATSKPAVQHRTTPPPAVVVVPDPDGTATPAPDDTTDDAGIGSD